MLMFLRVTESVLSNILSLSSCNNFIYRNTDHSDFVFYADRLIRLVIEEGLNRLPYKDVVVETPTHMPYAGIAFCKGNCGVSICRSGEAMEQALRQCCRYLMDYQMSPVWGSSRRNGLC